MCFIAKRTTSMALSRPASEGTFMAQLLILHVFSQSKPDTTKFEDCMTKNLEGIDYEFHYIQNIHLTETLNEFSKNMNANVLAMIQHDSNLITQLFRHSVTRRFTRKTSLPLLVIHD